MSPYIKGDELPIPHNSDPTYHHWSGGQPIIVTLVRLDAPISVFRNYVNPYDPSGETCKCGRPAEATSEVLYCILCKACWKKAD